MIRDIKFNRQHSEMIRVISQFKEREDVYNHVTHLNIGDACFGFFSILTRTLHINHRDFLYECGMKGDIFEDHHKKPIITEVMLKTLPKIFKLFKDDFTIKYY